MDFANDGNAEDTLSITPPDNASPTEWQVVSSQPPLKNSDSVDGDDEARSPYYVQPQIETDLDTEDEMPTHVSVEQLNAKSMEYDRIDRQIQEMAQNEIRMQEELSDDRKKYRRQMKHSEHNRHEEDSDTDDYKDLSSTTTSDPAHSPNSRSSLDSELSRTSHFG